MPLAPPPSKAGLSARLDRRPWASVVMPVRNGGTYLRTALESVARQELADVEVIVVEGGSTDDTVSTVRSFESRVPLTLVDLGNAGNWVAKTNIGIHLARGRFISFLHHDDAWAVDRLRTLRRAVDRFPQAEWFVHDARYIDAHGHTVGTWTCPLSCVTALIPPAVAFPRLLVQNFVPINGPFVRRDFLLRAMPMRESFQYTADWNLWLRLSSLGAVVHVPEILADFRIHAASMTLREASDPESFQRQFRDVLDEFLPALRNHGAEGRRWEALAEFSQLANRTLADIVNRRPASLPRLLREALRLGPVGLAEYLRFSRILPRTISRLRAASPTA